MSAPIKTSYDQTILTMAAEGAVCSEIVAATGKDRNQIRNRARYLGVWSDLSKSFQDRRAARKAGLLPCNTASHFNRRSAVARAAVPRARVDHAASNLLHVLRAARRQAVPSAPVPASFIARVFEAGLTLDDIDADLGVPPVEAIAAIRHHLEVRP